MSKTTNDVFKQSCLATALLSLSACSTTARQGPEAPETAIDTVVRVTRSTVETGSWAIDKTAYLFGFSDEDPEKPGQSSRSAASAPARDRLVEDTYPGAMDYAQVLPEYDTRSPVITAAPDLRDALIVHSEDPIELLDDGRSIDDNAGTIDASSRLLARAVIPTASIPVATIPAAATVNMEVPDAATHVARTAAQRESGAAEDTRPATASVYHHEVRGEETLWTIARETTGDANNWQAIATANELGPNAVVHPGQQLLIPDELLKPELAIASRAGAAATQTPTARPQRLDNPVAAIDESELHGSTRQPGRNFVLENGETLWEFSRRTTGDATNWKSIASLNALSEQQISSLQAGLSLSVPLSLLRPELSQPGSSPTPTPEHRDIPAAVKVTTVNVDPNAPVTVERAGSDIATPDKNSDIRIVEATFRNEDKAISLPAAKSTDNTEVTVKVSGTYYPKAVYNEADFSSSLLMRVSPGEELKAIAMDNGWYEVKTEKGPGYMHERDIR